MKITKNLLSKLAAVELDLEELFLLYTLANKQDWLVLYNFRPSSWYKLNRLLLVELDGNVVTEKGKTLLKNLDLFAKAHTNADIEEAFKVWWKNYPSYDDHGQWARTRRIKTSKTRAETLYRDLLRGGVSADFLLKAVDAEVDFRKKNSVKSNALQYMSNPATWLYQKEFEAYEDTPATDINDFIGYGKEID